MKECLKDLQLVFRNDGDSGDKRLEDTPTPEVNLSKLNRFMSKWSGIQDSRGMQLFSPETVKATEDLSTTLPVDVSPTFHLVQEPTVMNGFTIIIKYL